MKKSSGAMAIFMIIVLLGLGGAGFFLGWVQLTVPVGSYGVLRSKTHGLDPDIIREGKFRWVWYKLIPGNAVISVYSPNRVEHSFSISGELPHADLYRRFTSPSEDFSYAFSGSFAFMIDPESLPSLIESRGIAGQEDLEKLETSLAAEIESFIAQHIGEYRVAPEGLPEAGFANRLKQEISAAFPGINVLDTSVNAAKVPDFALYDSVHLVYQDFLASQRQSLAENIQEAAARNIDTQLRLDELAKYGELLSKYPILLQYPGIENDIPR